MSPRPGLQNEPAAPTNPAPSTYEREDAFKEPTRIYTRIYTRRGQCLFTDHNFVIEYGHKSSHCHRRKCRCRGRCPWIYLRLGPAQVFKPITMPYNARVNRCYSGRRNPNLSIPTVCFQA